MCITVEDMITNLTGILYLAEENTPSSEVEISIRSDNHWTLAAQLERDWSDVLRSSSCHETTYSSATGVEDVSPAELEELSGFGDCTLYNDVSIGIEVLLNHSREQGRDGRGEFGRLDHDRTASCDSSNHRKQGQDDREVPRSIIGKY